MSYNIIFPDRTGTSGQETISTENNIVLIGANGSGKTRLGVRIEELTQDTHKIHRTSAQKALTIPDFAEIKNLEQAENELIFGRSDEYANNQFKKITRWGEKPATFLLDDYSQLLSLLFAKSAKRDRDYTLSSKASQAYTEVPDAPIEGIVY